MTTAAGIPRSRPRPVGLDTRHAAAIGTAGHTAMLSVLALEHGGVTPDKGDVLVTGANGGVGSVAIALLASLGYRVIASTGRPEEAEYPTALGAAEIVERATLSEKGAPIATERWAGAVDSVGSHTLVNVLAQTRYGGVVPIADWRRAWTCRAPFCPLSCAA